MFSGPRSERAVACCMRNALQLILFAVALCIVSQPVEAGTCIVQDFAGSGTLNATNLNAKFTQVENCVNGSLGNVNISASEPLAISKLQNQYAIYSQSWGLD